MRTKITNFYCKDVEIENISKDYKIIEMSADTYRWLKIQIMRLENLSDGMKHFEDWNKEAKHALRLLEIAEARSKSIWFSKKEGSK